MMRRTTILLSVAISLMLVAVLGTAVACNDSSTDIFFPVQKSGLGGMDALLEGELELDNGYLRVVDSYSSDLAIWPHGFSVRIEGEEIQVIDSNGDVVARVGDQIKVGGGEVPAKFDEFIAEEIIGKSLPDDCVGPFWIVSGVVND